MPVAVLRKTMHRGVGVCVRACVRACVCVCVRERERERGRVIRTSPGWQILSDFFFLGGVEGVGWAVGVASVVCTS